MGSNLSVEVMGRSVPAVLGRLTGLRKKLIFDYQTDDYETIRLNEEGIACE